MNKVILSGNLTRDPELKVTGSGKSLVRMSIAVSRQYSKESADFFNLTAWDKTAEFCAQYLKKGSAVLIEGRVENDNYEKNGVKHYGVNIQVERLESLGKRQSDGAPPPDEDNDLPF